MTASSTRKRNTQNSVYEALRKSILTLNLLPGTAISENEISQRFEVSRTPVREAFIQLAKESLLQIIPQKETLVSYIDLEHMEQEHFLRKSLEASVLESFIKNSDDMTYLKLQQCIDMQSQILDTKDYLHFMSYDDLFHKTIFEVAGQTLSWEITENFSGHYYRVRLLTTWLNGIASDIIAQHSNLLNALKSKNLAEAHKILDEHLHKLDSEKDLLLKQFPAYFKTETPKNNFDVDFGGLKIK